MVGDDPHGKSKIRLFTELMNELKLYPRVRVLFVGDSFQIPPVKEYLSPIFTDQFRNKFNIKRYHLDTVLRQALDSPILRYATEIRETCGKCDSPEELKMPRDIKLIEQYIGTHYGSSDYLNNTDLVKIIAWTNKTVDYFNLVCRQIIYQTRELNMLMQSERIIVNRPHFLPDNVMLHNNMELTVESFYTSVDEFGLKIGDEYRLVKLPIYEARVSHEGEVKNFYNVSILHPDGIHARQQILTEMESVIYKAPPFKRGDLWKKFWNFYDRYLQFKYNYCITAHKSQGSTYEHALVIEQDILNNPNEKERAKIRYVAVTRPKTSLYVIR
jgi:hypothetical protein